MNNIKSILFFAEDITMAQVVRLKVLADSLEHTPVQVYFASSDFSPLIFSNSKFKCIKVSNIGQEAARKAVINCDRLYNEATLEKYIADDLKVLQEIKPDLIVSDFRLSLCISATICNIPLASLANAYWSPYTLRKSFPMPDHPWEGLIGVERMKAFYPLARPLAFQYFIWPFNSLRKKYGLPMIKGLQELLCYGDYTLYADVPEMHQMRDLPPNHIYLGSIQWSPDTMVDQELDALLKEPFIYATLGSSGRQDIMEELVKGLSHLPFKVLFATAMNTTKANSKNIYQKDYLPGALLAKHAKLVISNGGSTTGYQALHEGKPVIGIASNLDQYLCMDNLERLGAGRLLRAGSFQASQLADAVEGIVMDSCYMSSAKVTMEMLKAHNCQNNFKTFLQNISIL